jgi:peptidoglycan/xylan/chitin deacetylase (PgdA/CDA1 family)
MTARASVAIASLCSGIVWVRSRWAVPSVRVLTYHRFRDAPTDPFSVRPAEFEWQMSWLAERRLAVSLDDLLDFVGGRRPLRPGAVLVTIDDGFEELVTIALPVLERHGIPAVAFVSAADLDDTSADDRHDSHKVTGSQVRWLADRGVEIASHGWRHRSLGAMDLATARLEAERSRLILERVVGRDVRAFAYPYGTRRDYSTDTGRVLKETGYRCAFTSQHGAVRRGSELIDLPRIKIEGDDRRWLFRVALKGGLDAWALIDRIGSRFQSTPAAGRPTVAIGREARL